MAQLDKVRRNPVGAAKADMRPRAKAKRVPIGGNITVRDVTEAIENYLSSKRAPCARIGPANEVTFATQELSGYFDDEPRYRTVHYRVKITKLD